MERLCTSCKKLKPVEAFAFKNKRRGVRHSMCRGCKTEYNRSWYRSNENTQKRAVRENRRSRAEAQREIIRDAKDRPCADCGKVYPYYVMDMDHRDPAKKLDSVSKMAGKASTKAILAEIEKCDVVCSNCHRIRTHAPDPAGRELVF